MKKFYYILSCLFLLNSCNSNIGRFPEMFVGTWNSDNPELKSNEVWTKINDSIYSGKSFTMNIQKEELELIRKGNNWYYIVLINGQNNDEPIPFKLIKQTNTKFIFENKAHDFPQLIEYNFRSANNLIVYLRANGKEYEEYFNKAK
ncbi:MAG TPA: DUF6265 family protein [Chitinophagales bacterium]|nr:DUF6265 family protein [Chitinophagales bacterium]